MAAQCKTRRRLLQQLLPVAATEMRLIRSGFGFKLGLRNLDVDGVESVFEGEEDEGGKRGVGGGGVVKGGG